MVAGKTPYKVSYRQPTPVDFLAEAGAFDERVTAATGEPLTEESAPMQTVRAYLAAIQAGDLQAMERLRTRMSPGWTEGTGLDVWQKDYMSKPTLKQGFGNDYATTVKLEAHKIEDLHVREFFHLVRDQGRYCAMAHVAIVGRTFVEVFQAELLDLTRERSSSAGQTVK
jgi:hypothetical protein